MATDGLRMWLQGAQLSGAEVDCITAVMLKILDCKCKMPEHERQIMAALYGLSKHLTGKHLGERYHQLIATALVDGSESMLATVYETRVLAETQISRPVMKAFKGRLRKEGVLPSKQAAGANDD